MEIKFEPNVRCCWKKSYDILWCPVVSFIITWNHFEYIVRCLHVHNNHGAAIDQSNVEFDKLVKLMWLLDKFRDRCNNMWNLDDKVTIDEMMIQYKGKYCFIRQYMPKKPTKWEIRVWCQTYSEARYVWTFKVYCGTNNGIPGIKGSKKSGVVQGANVVHRWLRRLENIGLIMIMNNFFYWCLYL